MNLLDDIPHETQSVLQQGGPVLWAMVVLSVVLYAGIVSTWVGLVKVKSDLLSLSNDVVELEEELDIFALEQLAWVKRRLPMIAVMVAAAPLAGLLGTVFGMFVTFSGLSEGGNGVPMDGISAGISAAMITTQVGLFMAIPGAILLAILRSQVSGVEATLEQKRYHERVEIRQQQGGVRYG